MVVERILLFDNHEWLCYRAVVVAKSLREKVLHAAHDLSDILFLCSIGATRP